MRKAFQRAVEQQLDQDGEITGYMVVTFRDGVATFSSDASEGDEPAQEILAAIATALTEPESVAADDDDDAIGVCAGSA
jgi:hypothetical protein